MMWICCVSVVVCCCYVVAVDDVVVVVSLFFHFSIITKKLLFLLFSMSLSSRVDFTTEEEVEKRAIKLVVLCCEGDTHTYTHTQKYIKGK